MDQIWLNSITRCPRIIPADYLRAHRPLTGELDPSVFGLRGNAQKRERELVEASLFAYGLQCRTDQPVLIVDTPESFDYDVVIDRKINGDNCFTRIQLKEVVTPHRNLTGPPATLGSTAAAHLRLRVRCIYRRHEVAPGTRKRLRCHGA